MVAEKKIHHPLQLLRLQRLRAAIYYNYCESTTTTTTTTERDRRRDFTPVRSPSRLHAQPARSHSPSPWVARRDSLARSTRRRARSSFLRFLGFRPLHPPRCLHFLFNFPHLIPLQTLSKYTPSHAPSFQIKPLENSPP